MKLQCFLKLAAALCILEMCDLSELQKTFTKSHKQYFPLLTNDATTTSRQTVGVDPIQG